jgi:putative ABC transport system substrate-binding protein
VAFLINPANPNSEPDKRNLAAAAAVTAQKILTAGAASAREIDAAFALIVQRRAGALLLQTDPLLNSRRDQIAALALRHAVPAMASYREFALAGGLVSYGADAEDSWRQMGAYVARVAARVALSSVAAESALRCFLPAAQSAALGNKPVVSHCLHTLINRPSTHHLLS